MSWYPELYLRGGIMRDYETPADKLTRSKDKLQSEQGELKSGQDKLKSGQDKLQSEQAELQSEQAELKREQAELQSEQAVLKSEQAELQSEQAELKSEQDELKSGQAKLKPEQIRQKRSRNTFEEADLGAELQTQPRRGKRETTVQSSKCRVAQQRQSLAEKELRYCASILASLLHNANTESLASLQICKVAPKDNFKSLQNCKGTDCAQAPCELVEPKMKSED
jgi:chromosome segregation ATPase